MLIVGDIVFLDQFWMRTSKKCLQFFRLTFQGQMSRSKFKILKMPCLDLKQAAFDKKLDFWGEIQSISEFYTQRFSIFHIKV